jgi:transposase-like protein
MPSCATGRQPAADTRRPGAIRASALHCPACGSSHVAQVLGDNGGVSYVCTACGHSWS